MTQRDNNGTPGTSRPFTFDRVVRMLIGIFALGAALWIINILKDVLLPFLVAWLIAYMLEPFVQYNKRLLRAKGRLLPIVMTLFECLLILCVIATFVVPSVIDEMHQVAEFVRSYAKENAQITFIPEWLHEYLRTKIDFETISRELTRQDLQSILEGVASFIAGGYDVVLGIFNWFVVILYVVFIMLDYDNLLKGMRHMVPPKYREQVFGVLNNVKTSMNHYFRGQALIASIVGVLFCIGFLIIGMPMAVVLGLFIGVLNMVPYLQLISLVPTTLLCLVVSASGGTGFWPMFAATITVYCVVQCIQDLFLTPKIMGKSMGLNPAIILLSLSVWGTLLGFIGLIIALPLTTLLLSYYSMYISSREDGETPEQRQEDANIINQITHINQ